MDVDILIAIRDSFQNFHFNARDFNSLLDFIEDLGRGEIDDLSPKKISDVALELATISDGEQKLIILEKDSFFRIELQYYF